MLLLMGVLSLLKMSSLVFFSSGIPSLDDTDICVLDDMDICVLDDMDIWRLGRLEGVNISLRSDRQSWKSSPDRVGEAQDRDEKGQS